VLVKLRLGQDSDGEFETPRPKSDGSTLPQGMAMCVEQTLRPFMLIDHCWFPQRSTCSCDCGGQNEPRYCAYDQYRRYLKNSRFHLRSSDASSRSTLILSCATRRAGSDCFCARHHSLFNNRPCNQPASFFDVELERCC